MRVSIAPLPFSELYAGRNNTGFFLSLLLKVFSGHVVVTVENLGAVSCDGLQRHWISAVGAIESDGTTLGFQSSKCESLNEAKENRDLGLEFAVVLGQPTLS